MRKYIFDQTTGEIITRIASCPEHEAYWTNQGYSVLEDTDKAGGCDTHRVVGGVLTLKFLVVLAPDKMVIAADDTDVAVVAVQVAGEAPPVSMEIEVDGVPATVTLVGGQGQLPPITSPVEHVFEVRAADQITYTDNGGCTVTAVDQE